MHDPIDPDPGRALLDRLNAEAEKGGGEARIQKQHEAGKLTARERIDILLDPGSFVEVDKFKTHRCAEFGMEKQKVLGDGVVTGYGLVGGRQVFLFAQDFTVFGGSLSGAFAEKICKVMDLALEVGCPVIGLADSGGARIQEGVVPQISVILGPCAGGAAYGPAITDFIFMVKDTSYMFTTGPDVIRSVTNEEVTLEELGGAKVHVTRSGVAHFAHDSEDAALKAVRELLAYLPLNNREDPPAQACSDDVSRRDDLLRTIVPDDPSKPYDMREVVKATVDDHRFFEVGEHFAGNVLVGFARLNGRPVGIVANQPAVLDGVLDVDASLKAARFVRCCDAFNVPLLTFVYVGAYAVMASKHLRADVNLAWPTAEIAVMNPEGAVHIVFRKEIQAAKDPVAERARLVQRYRDELANPYKAAELGYVDEVMKPEETRPRVIRAFEMLRTKRRASPPRRHGNLPL